MVKVTPSDGVERLRLATLDRFDGQSWRISPESRFQRGGDTADQDTTGPLRTTEIEIVGSASVGRVHIPLPGLGTVDDFGFDIDARLAMASRSA